MTDDEMIDEVGFFHNIKLENGILLPSRASRAILLGLEKELDKEYKDEDERERSLKLKQMLISALYDPLFEDLEELVKKGELTELDCFKMLENEGKELAKEFKGDKDEVKK